MGGRQTCVSINFLSKVVGFWYWVFLIKNIEDMRESPSLKLMELLQAKGALIEYSDPLVPVFPRMREYIFNLASLELSPANVATFDVVLLATNHDLFDYAMIKTNAKLIVDTRGVYLEPDGNVVKA